MIPKLYDEKAAAAMLGVSRSTLRNERLAGRVAFTRVASLFRYTEQHLADYLEQNTTPCRDQSHLSGSASSSSPAGRRRRTGTSPGTTDGQGRPDAEAWARRMLTKPVAS